MKNGDLVVGKPIKTDGPEQLPDEVCGTLEIAEGNVGRSTWNIYLVYVLDDDGAKLPVECEEDSVRLATRRQEVTVL